MRIIDCHAHVYPDKIAGKASDAIGDFYNIKMAHDGTAASLLKSGERNGVTGHIIHSVATIPEQVRTINDFIAKTVRENPERFIGFATLIPGMDGLEKEIERIRELGLKGVKLHPDFQKFNIDDPVCDRMYGLLEGNLPLLIHTGDGRYERAFSSPKRIAPVTGKFPELKIICAHFGGYTEWDIAAEALAGKNVWADTSSSLSYIGKKKTRELISLFGENKVVFGTDYPMWDAGSEIEMIMSLGLGEETAEKIFWKNISDLIGI